MENDEMNFYEFDKMSGEGYERDDSRVAEELSISSKEPNMVTKNTEGKHAIMPIIRKRIATTQSEGNQVSSKKTKVNNLSAADSGYEQDMSSDVALSGSGNGKVDREEETQVLTYSIGKYIDHSLDPDDNRPFAPVHRKPNFPESLFAILSNTYLSSIIEWLPHGRSFIILDREEFAKSVLPAYFRHNNMPSFNRQLNGYGYKKLKIGVEKSYYHPYFLRNLPHLVKNIKRCTNVTDEQKISSESVLETASAERPLPERMSRTYAKRINKMNQDIDEGLALIRLQEKPEALESTLDTLSDAGLPPVPSIIYASSPRPSPQAIYTPPSLLPQQQPQSSPSYISHQNYGYGDVALPCQQGTAFTQTHLPLTGLTTNSASQSLNLPLQTQAEPPLPFQIGASVQPNSNVPMNFPNSGYQNNAIELRQAQSMVIANKIRQQAQNELFVNAIAAAIGQQGQNLQPLPTRAPSQLVTNPRLNLSSIKGTTQLAPNSQVNGTQQQTVTRPVVPPRSSSNLQHHQQHNSYSDTIGHGQNMTDRLDQCVQPFLTLGASQLLSNQRLNTSIGAPTSPLSQLNASQQQQQQQQQHCSGNAHVPNSQPHDSGHERSARSGVRQP
mmetsp:Transcript_20678/g.43172  ORF Transcript_20678/g.43172 Transcript_20678/m.43172 type:complete len:612 (-) Transcript_20678:82-1917(-)